MVKTAIKRLFQNCGYQISRVRDPAPGTDILHDIRRYAGDFPIALVFDVGANVGQSARRFSDTFAEAAIFSFEPVPSTFRVLEQAAAMLPRVKCFNLGCAASPGETVVFPQPHSVWNSLVPEINEAKEGNRAGESVKLETIDRIANQHGFKKIDLLKTDTEGLDLDVLRGATDLLDLKGIRFVIVEVGFHELDRRHSSFAEVNKLLLAKGFCLAGFYDQMFFPQLGREGYHCDALFMLLRT